VVSTPDGEHTIAVSYDRYPMVPLYSDLQVQPIDGCNSSIDAGTVNDDKIQAENSSCSEVIVEESEGTQQADSIAAFEGKQALESLNLPAVIDIEANDFDAVEILEAGRLNGDTNNPVNVDPTLNAQSDEIIVSGLNDSDSAKPFVNTRKSTAKLVAEIKACDEDFEWYPTTDEIIQAINSDLDSDDMPNVDSVLDCGAGDGRVLEKLSAYRKYAIEKSKPLLDAMSKDIFVVGTDFAEQVLIEKKVDVVFSNPPYSEYEKWVVKIITQANAKYLYLVIPDRWQTVKAIQDALDSRGAETQVMGEFDFLNAERKAGAFGTR